MGIFTVAGTLVGAGADALFGGTDRDPRRLCPGTPNIVGDVAIVLREDPGLLSEIRADVSRIFSGEKDLAVAQAIMGTADGVAQAAVWLSWGGADCKTGSKEPPLQIRLQEIARRGAQIRSTTGTVVGEQFTTPSTITDTSGRDRFCEALPEPFRSQCFSASRAGAAAFDEFQRQFRREQTRQVGGLPTETVILAVGGLVVLFLLTR